MIRIAKNSRATPLLLLLIGIIVCIFDTQAFADQVAPEFCLKDINGQNVCLKDFLGKVVILEFWATWCLPCRAYVPELNRLQERYRRQGLVVVGICIEDAKMLPDEDLRIYKQSKEIKYNILRANQNLIKTWFPEQRLSIPTFIVIKRNGQIGQRIFGTLPMNFESRIATFLK